MFLSQVLLAEGVAPSDVTVLLHKTTLQPLRRMFPALVFERPDLFEAYQSVHADRAAITIRSRSYVASFIPLAADRMLFAGLYEVLSSDLLPTAEIYADQRFAELSETFGATDTDPDVNIAARQYQRRFELRQMIELDALRGRLQIETPVGRTYARLAENLNAPVVAISEDAITSPHPPDWREFVIAGAEVRALPRSWRAKLTEWRGVYLIVDTSDGARYVGCAYGQENLFGRWATHVAGDAGVTKELGRRDPAGFRFSILELLSPTAAPDDVISAENNWKDRLHTRQFGLNVN